MMMDKHVMSVDQVFQIELFIKPVFVLSDIMTIRFQILVKFVLTSVRPVKMEMNVLNSRFVINSVIDALKTLIIV